MPKILYLLDGHAIAYRAYFALTAGGNTRWTTSTGEPTAGIYGFASMLIRILEQEEPDYMAVSFDTGRTFRHELYGEYKATRAKMPEDLRQQIERIREMVDLLGIPRIEMENYEADDVIGSLAVWAADKEGLGVKIITGDRDLLQMVTNRIVVTLPNARTNQNEDFFPEDVEKKLGVFPNQVVDYKALLGDTSDNIPGVRGIGEKTAVALLKEYGTLDNVYAHLDQLTGRAQKALEEGRKSAYLSQDLARIRTDLGVSLDLDKARADNFNPGALVELFRQLEFRTITQRLKALEQKLKPEMATPVQASLFIDEGPAASPNTPKIADGLVQTIIVDTPTALRDCVRTLGAAKQIALDTETSELDPMRADLVGISLACDPDQGFYIPVGHLQGKQLPLEEVRIVLDPLLSNPKIDKVAHNAKFDLLVLRQAGFSLEPITFDTMIAEWLINPTSRNLGLKSQAWIRLGVEMTHIEALIGTGRNQISMAQVPIAQAAPYAAADAAMTLRLVEPLTARLEEVRATGLNRDLEVRLIPVLAEMEEAGILLDLPLFDVFSEELARDISDLEDSIYQQVGERFNLNSTQQLSDMLFKRLNLEPPDRSQKTSSGKYSTSASVLESMRDTHPIIEKILTYRELSKLKSTYVDALPLQVNPRTGRVHTSFNQTGTVTGRIASQNPNLQNIPTRTEQGRRVRNGFIAAPGCKLLAIDYSQVELRIMAHMSQDSAMLKAFREGQDIHAATAAAITKTPIDQVTKEQRRHAKAINFGLIYGMGSFGLTRASDLTLAEAENFILAYFREFPGVKVWLEKTKQQAAQLGYVEALLGRRRYFPDLVKGTNPVLRRREEREAINAPIQGTAADIVKIAMIQLPGVLRHAGLKAKMLLQVHDELIFEVPEEELEQTTHVAKSVMENAMKLDVPLTTEARVGRNWGELEKVDDTWLDELLDQAS